MPIKKHKSSKLFYNKWPYKVECFVLGSSKIIWYGPDLIIDWCIGKNHILTKGFNDRIINKDKLREFAGSVAPFLDRKEEIQIRVEGGHFNLFCKDPDIFSKIISSLDPWIQHIHEPASEEELQFLLDNNNKRVLCDQIPYEKYTYKVVLKSTARGIKQQFYDWSQNYSEDQIKISPQTIKWLVGTYSYKQDPFFYVSDGPMLTMARLFLGDRVRKVFEYVPRDTLEKG